MSTEIHHFIDGAPLAGASVRTAPVFNPATGKQTGTVVLASSAEVDAAVQAAKRAFPNWAATPPLRRARILNRFLAILNERTGQLAAAYRRAWKDHIGCWRRDSAGHGSRRIRHRGAPAP